MLGCNFATVVPTPFVFAEGPAAIGKKRYRLDVGGGVGSGACCGFVGGGAGGQARLRYGFSERAEIGVGSFAMFAGSGDRVKKRYPEFLWLSSKVDFKWQLNRWAALLLGAGGGLTPYAPFLGGDLGIVMGRPGRKRVSPYGGLRLGVSGPVGSVDRIDTSVAGDVSTGPVVGNMTVQAAGGFLANFTPDIAFVLEGGCGAIIPFAFALGGVGGAGYFYTGLSFRLGGP